MTRRDTIIIAGVFVAGALYGGCWVGGPGAALAFLALGLVGGAALRAWWALPLLGGGLLLGNAVRIAPGAWGTLASLNADTDPLRLIGEGVFGMALAYAPLTLLLAPPVGLGIWLARRRPRRALRDWAR